MDINKVTQEEKYIMAAMARSEVEVTKTSMLTQMGTQLDIILERYDPFSQWRILRAGDRRLERNITEVDDSKSLAEIILKMDIPADVDQWSFEETFAQFCKTFGISFD